MQHKVRVNKQKCLICNDLFYSVDSHKRHSDRVHNGVVTRKKIEIFVEKEEPTVCEVISPEKIDDAWFNQIIEQKVGDEL